MPQHCDRALGTRHNGSLSRELIADTHWDVVVPVFAVYFVFKTGYGYIVAMPVESKNRAEISGNIELGILA